MSSVPGDGEGEQVQLALGLVSAVQASVHSLKEHFQTFSVDDLN